MEKNTFPEMTEDQEQAQLFAWARMEENRYPELRWLFAIPNGGQRSITTARRLKATGTKAGVPDTFLPAPRGPYHGLWIEMKKQKGGKVSPEQTIWLTGLEEQGYKTAVCHGAMEAIDVITEYLGEPKREKIYICDPQRATTCEKSLCGICYKTFFAEWAKRDESGRPIETDRI